MSGWRRFAACAAAGLLWAGAVGAERVVLKDGRTLDGVVRLEEGAVVVESAGASQRLAIDGVREAQFTMSKSPAAAATRPAEWTGRDIGSRKEAGRLIVEGGRVRIRDGGQGLYKGEMKERRRADSFYFAWQKLAGDGQITARIWIAEPSRSARAGLMIRESFLEESPYVAVLRENDREGSAIQARLEQGGIVKGAGESEQAILGAAWLRLTRSGDRFAAAESVDGRTWKTVGEVAVAMTDAPVYVGLAVANCHEETWGEAIFSNVELTAGSALADPGQLKRGIVLRSGSALGCQVLKADETTVTVSREMTIQRLPRGEVARLVFRPLNAAQQSTLDRAGSGVLLRNGDFVEGSLRSVDGGEIKVGSVLFGAKVYEAVREAAAVALGPVAPAQCAVEVKLADGSVLRASRLEVKGREAFIDAAGLGPVRVSAADVAGLRANP